MNLTHECARLRCKFNGPGPCERNFARAREQAGDSGDKYIGILHHCLECQGKELREVEKHMALQVSEAEAEKILGPEKMAALTQKDEYDPDAPAITAAGTLVPVRAVKSPEQGPVLIKGEYCKNHPEVKAHINKHGAPMGLCLECLRERAARNSRNRGLKKGMATPAVREALLKKPEKDNEPAPVIAGDNKPEPEPYDYRASHVVPESVLPEALIAATKPGRVLSRNIPDMDIPYAKLLLEKLPVFDPGWPEPIIQKWLEVFERFMEVLPMRGLAPNDGQ